MKQIFIPILFIGFLNACDQCCDKYTKLNFESRQRKLTDLNKTLKKGVDVNHQDNEGNTALHYAAWEGEDKTIEILVKNGADLNIKNNYGQTPLMFAVWNVKHCAAQTLLDLGADIDMQDENGDTVMMITSYLSRPKVARDMANTLLDYSPNLKIKNNCKDTALILAVKADKYYLTKVILDYMLEQLDDKEVIKILNQRDCTKSNALINSIELFNNHLTNLILDAGSDIEIENGFGNTPIMLAILKRNLVIIDRLICMGADLNHQNRCGYTPLMFAVTNGQDKMAIKLINNGAKIGIKNNNNQNAIEVAKTRQYREIAKALEDFYVQKDGCSMCFDFESLY